MAGVHIRWCKRALRAQWDLRSAPGFVGRISAVRDSQGAPLAYTWSVGRRPSEVTGNPATSGTATTLSEARLVASRAVFAAIRMSVEIPNSGSACIHQTAV